RARRAIGGYGLDRAELARVVFQRHAKPLVSVLAPGVPDAIDLNEMYPYKPDEAKRLLKELGYDDNHPLHFTILISNQDATMADIATLIKIETIASLPGFDMAPEKPFSYPLSSTLGTRRAN